MPKTITFSDVEADVIREKLTTLMEHVNSGVDVWLSPGEATSQDCFVDYDDPCVDALNGILNKLQQ